MLVILNAVKNLFFLHCHCASSFVSLRMTSVRKGIFIF